MPSAPIHRRIITLLDHGFGSEEFTDGFSPAFVPDFLSNQRFASALFASDIGTSNPNCIF